MLRPALARPRLRSAAPTDRTLVERMSRGDEAAFRDLLARYRSTMYATAYAALVDPEQVDATVADALPVARPRLEVDWGLGHSNNLNIFRSASRNLFAGRDLYAAHPEQHLHNAA